MREWFFLGRRWIGWGCIISGVFIAGIAMFNVIQYARGADAVYEILGRTPMAFSTAALFVVSGLSTFWTGWLIRHDVTVVPIKKQFTNAQLVQLTMAVISAGSMIAVALIGAWKK